MQSHIILQAEPLDSLQLQVHQLNMHATTVTFLSALRHIQPEPIQVAMHKHISSHAVPHASSQPVVGQLELHVSLFVAVDLTSPELIQDATNVALLDMTSQNKTTQYKETDICAMQISIVVANIQDHAHGDPGGSSIQTSSEDRRGEGLQRRYLKN